MGKRIPDVPVIERLMARSTFNPESGCWVWNGARDNKNYGVINVSSKRQRLVHQASWEFHHGGMPAGLELDHLCHTRNLCGLNETCPHRACWTIEHLELVTHQENIRRGESPAGINARKTHCDRSHPLDGPESNVYLTSAGRRQCRPCKVISQREYTARMASGEIPRQPGPGRPVSRHAEAVAMSAALLPSQRNSDEQSAFVAPQPSGGAS